LATLAMGSGRGTCIPPKYPKDEGPNTTI